MTPRFRLVVVALLSAAALVPAVGAQAAPDINLNRPTLTYGGVPVWGTLQNLPGMGSKEFTWVGPTLAPTIEAYYAGDRWRADLARSRDRAKALLRTLLDQQCGGDPKACKAMVVFDIDETLLNNYGYWSTQDPPFTLDSATFATWATSCGESALKPTVQFYKYAQKMGVKIALITGRAESLRKATRECLKKRGMTGWHELILKGPDDTRMASWFKADARATLERRGYTILVSVGDQLSDMAHGHTLSGVWLPNPMYFIP